MVGAIVISVVVGMVVFLGLHLILWRRRLSNTPRMFLLTVLALIGLAASAAAQIALEGLNPLSLFTALWIDTFLIISYFFVYAGICRSVSVTVLSRLLGCQEQQINFETLVEEYVRSSRFEDRIRLMDESGLVRLSGHSVILTPKGFALARTVRFFAGVAGRSMEG